jgi:hypothetical protein
MIDPLTAIAWLVISLGLASCAMILFDVFVDGQRQDNWIMEIVWPLTALYLGPLALWLYWRYGRASAYPERSMWVSTAFATSRYGAGCTFGNIIGSSAVFLFGLKVAWLNALVELPLDFVLAFGLGIYFLYLADPPQVARGLREALAATVRAHGLRLLVFQTGVFSWMILAQMAVLAPHGIRADSPTFWLMMQVGSAVGFLASFLGNWWHVRAGEMEGI